MTGSGHFPRMRRRIPVGIDRWVNPVDKTNPDPLRFVHFAVLALVTVRFIPRDWASLKWSGFRPSIICGEHSLEIFCLGIFLAFVGHFLLVQVPNRARMRILFGLAGIVVLFVVRRSSYS